MQILFWKKRAEEELQRSGLDYTIIRPGELLWLLLLPAGEPFPHGCCVACPGLHSSCLVSSCSCSCCCACQQVSPHAIVLGSHHCKCSPIVEHRRLQRANQKEKEQTEKAIPQRLNRERKVEKEKA